MLKASEGQGRRGERATSAWGGVCRGAGVVMGQLSVQAALPSFLPTWCQATSLLSGDVVSAPIFFRSKKFPFFVASFLLIHIYLRTW